MKREQFCDHWMFGKTGEKMVSVTLPHDATQYEIRQPDAASGSGGAYYPGGSYIYEKAFTAPEDWKEKTVLVEFEGVYPCAQVFLNGKEIGAESYGYNLFRVELTEILYGQENTLRVEADNSRVPNSRWYAGAGIYRPVWLLTGNREHILPDGVRITTLSYEPAQIMVEVETSAARGTKQESTEILTVICDPGGKAVLSEELTMQDGKYTAVLDIPDAQLWDDENPNLYTCEISLCREGVCLDSASTVFGIRKLKWSTEGFLINGKSVLL
ncbi:MAG: hypothetical protein LUE87_06735 [Lachnospiraceae bacterium]|nr:hypothetical protein [Lachnospiraceae bacterium]